MIKTRKIQSTGIPYYNVCDIETDKYGNVLDIGFAWYENNERKYSIFKSWDEFIYFIITLCKSKIISTKIYAHNGSNFDWLSLSQWALESDNWKRIKVVLSGSKGIGIDINLGNKRGVIRLRDSICLLLSSLEKLSLSFLPEHTKIDLSGLLPEEILNKNPKLYYEYLKMDCFALQDILRKFHQLINEQIGYIDVLPMTIASLSYKLWRDNYLPYSIMTPWNKKVKDFCRRSYTGGRVQAFKPGEYQDIKGYDINSLYPFIMTKYDIPISYKGYWTCQYKSQGIYEIDFEQSQEYPAILRDEISGEFQYSGSGVFCHTEIDKLLKINGKINIKKGFIFCQWGNPFKEYILKLYNLRMQSSNDNNTALNFICKILGNSLYGKFGQRPESEELQALDQKELCKKISQGKKVKIYGNVCSIYTHKNLENEFVAISSYITTNARLELYKYLESNTAIYADTDSIYTKIPLNNNCISMDLGAMKNIFSGSGIFVGKKQYALMENNIEKIVLKGIPTVGRNKANVSYTDFKLFLQGQSKAYTYKTVTSVRDVFLKNKKACFFESKSRIIKMNS